ncbi:hypothetical protein [Dyadobacter psychrotolerans]|uniref:Uncharacterized protein n=1 Tax=Dyadobacter psychrotolerans TaxID=2541721 RepID=A0A4R5D5G2_9BACT|nr:hypothetical protein [Dyadobacter psychrotolerans]TDE08692.1 hypothetical protein E0F88_32190 [Dyadobacter psychrotolerans]
MADIQTIMQQMKIDLDGSSVHYFIVGQYMLDSRDEIFSSIHFHKDSAFDLVFESNRLSANVILNKQRPDDLFKIGLQYSKIWTVAKGNSAFFTNKDNIYTNPDALDYNINRA